MLLYDDEYAQDAMHFLPFEVIPLLPHTRPIL